MACPLSIPALNGIIDGCDGDDDGSDDRKPARDMIDVHRSEAANLVRENGRAAALAGQATRATSRIKVLGMIQRQQAGGTSFIPTSGDFLFEVSIVKIKNTYFEIKINPVPSSLFEIY
jgi:hypothetical protein